MLSFHRSINNMRIEKFVVSSISQSWGGEVANPLLRSVADVLGNMNLKETQSSRLEVAPWGIITRPGVAAGVHLHLVIQ